MEKIKIKWMEIIIAIFGAVDYMFDIFMPLALTLLLINIYDISYVNSILLLTCAILTALYRSNKALIKLIKND